jgi:hypothetical protein
MKTPTKKIPSSLSLLAECAEFLDGIGIIEPSFDRRVEQLIQRMQKNSPSIKQYMKYCAGCRDRNEDSKDFDSWNRSRKG